MKATHERDAKREGGERRAPQESLPRVVLLAGAAWGVFAVSIWAGWFVLTRLWLIEGLSAHDIVALRFLVAGLVLLPVVGRRGFGLDRLGWGGLLVIGCGAGAPYALVASAGLIVAPSAHGAALTPGALPLFVAGLSVLVLSETLSGPRKTGLVLILVGVLCIGGLSLLMGRRHQWVGHLLFLTGSLMWAAYTVALKRSRLSPLHGTAIVAVGSLVIYVPFYAAVLKPTTIPTSLRSLVLAAAYQGVLTSVVSLIAYNRAVQILGASRGAAFASLGPAMALLVAIPVLGEVPSASEIVGVALVSVGVYLATGARITRRSQGVTGRPVTP